MYTYMYTCNIHIKYILQAGISSGVIKLEIKKQTNNKNHTQKSISYAHCTQTIQKLQNIAF